MLNKGINEMSGRMNVDPTRYKFIKNALNFIVAFIAAILIIYTIPQLKALALTLFAGAGIILALITFAAQAAFSNIVNGVFLIVSKPFRVGDMIKVGHLDYGIVEDITLRHTIIRDFKNKSIIIPNGVIGSETVINDSIGDPKICRWVEVGISYDSDLEKAIRLIREVAEAYKECVDIRSKADKDAGVPKVVVRHIGFGDSSINLRAYVWINDPLKAIQTQSDLNIAIKKRFDEEGVEIPFPYRTIVYKKDLPPNT